MAKWARTLANGIQIFTNPSDTSGLLPVVENFPAKTASQNYGGYTLAVGPSQVTITYLVENTDPFILTTNTLLAKVVPALANNQAFLNIASPSTNQTLAQVQALTRQIDTLAKYLFSLLDNTTGT